MFLLDDCLKGFILALEVCDAYLDFSEGVEYCSICKTVAETLFNSINKVPTESVRPVEKCIGERIWAGVGVGGFS